MAQSFLSAVPFAAPDPMPWNWNPGQTFVTAFNETRLLQARANQLEMEAELERILLPAKAAEAEFNIKKLQLDSEFLTNFHKARTAALPGAYRGLNQAVSGSGSTVPGSDSNVVSQDQQPQQQLGYSNRLRKTGAGTLGSNLQPIQPVGGD